MDDSFTNREGRDSINALLRSGPSRTILPTQPLTGRHCAGTFESPPRDMAEFALPAAIPESLARLLATHGDHDTDVAWKAFLDAHSTLLLQVARSTVPGHDNAMDAYAFLLESLRE